MQKKEGVAPASRDKYLLNYPDMPDIELFRIKLSHFFTRN